MKTIRGKQLSYVWEYVILLLIPHIMLTIGLDQELSHLLSTLTNLIAIVIVKCHLKFHN